MGEKEEKYQKIFKKLEVLTPWGDVQDVASSWENIQKELYLARHRRMFQKFRKEVALEAGARGQEKGRREALLKLRKLKVPSYAAKKQKKKKKKKKTTKTEKWKWFLLLEQIMLGEPLVGLADLDLTDDTLQLSQMDRAWLKATLQKLQDHEPLSGDNYQHLYQMLAKVLSEKQRDWLHMASLQAMTLPWRQLADTGPTLSEEERKKITIGPGRLKVIPPIQRGEAKPPLTAPRRTSMSVRASAPATSLAPEVSTTPLHHYKQLSH
ncbi:uncharacterized protein LOC144454248 [Phascolarctos cinereus]